MLGMEGLEQTDICCDGFLENRLELEQPRMYRTPASEQKTPRDREKREEKNRLSVSVLRLGADGDFTVNNSPPFLCSFHSYTVETDRHTKPLCKTLL